MKSQNGQAPDATRLDIRQHHIHTGERGNPRANPLALALIESRAIENPRAFPTKVFEDDPAGRKIRSYRNSPPITRWLNQWERGEDPGPMEIVLNRKGSRICLWTSRNEPEATQTPPPGSAGAPAGPAAHHSSSRDGTAHASAGTPDAPPPGHSGHHPSAPRRAP